MTFRKGKSLEFFPSLSYPFIFPSSRFPSFRPYFIFIFWGYFLFRHEKVILDQTVAVGKGNFLNELSGNKIPRITRDDILQEANRVSMASSEANETAGGGCKEILILHIYKVFTYIIFLCPKTALKMTIRISHNCIMFVSCLKMGTFVRIHQQRYLPPPLSNLLQSDTSAT